VLVLPLAIARVVRRHSHGAVTPRRSAFAKLGSIVRLAAGGQPDLPDITIRGQHPTSRDTTFRDGGADRNVPNLPWNRRYPRCAFSTAARPRVRPRGGSTGNAIHARMLTVRIVYDRCSGGDFATNPECIWSREGGIRSRSRSDPIIVDLSTPLVYVARLGRTTRLSP
jgi:hypothetical protein